jgi:GrpB-like predicted nucleotidyltransferase (UPF0157 family)
MTPDFASDPIVLVPHRAEWEDLARREIAAIRAGLAGMTVSGIQHIGSTAIPGIRAKPILDIQVLVPALAEAQEAIAALCALGYEYWAANPGRLQLLLVKGRPPQGAGRSHHVHLLQDREAFENAMLFRDALIGDPALAGEYDRFKRDLARRFSADGAAYEAGKTEFVRDVVRNARWATA